MPNFFDKFDQEGTGSKVATADAPPKPNFFDKFDEFNQAFSDEAKAAWEKTDLRSPAIGFGRVAGSVATVPAIPDFSDPPARGLPTPEEVVSGAGGNEPYQPQPSLLRTVASSTAGIVNKTGELLSGFTTPANFAVTAAMGALNTLAEAPGPILSRLAKKLSKTTDLGLKSLVGKDVVDSAKEALKTEVDPHASRQEKAAAWAQVPLSAIAGLADEVKNEKVGKGSDRRVSKVNGDSLKPAPLASPASPPPLATESPAGMSMGSAPAPVAASFTPKNERFTAGVTTDKGVNDQGIDTFSPAKQEAARLDLRDTISQTKGVKSVRLTDTNGLYGGSVERSFDVDVTAKTGTEMTPVFSKIIEVGRDSNQTDVFMSKVVGPDHPNARPAFEINFEKPATPEQVQSIVDRFRAAKSSNFPDGIDGFTLAKNSKGEVLGIRAQYVPEISGRWNESVPHLDPTKVGELAGEWRDNSNTVLDGLNKKTDNIKSAHDQSVSTHVVGAEEYASAKPDTYQREALAESVGRRANILGRRQNDQAASGDTGAPGVRGATPEESGNGTRIGGSSLLRNSAAQGVAISQLLATPATPQPVVTQPDSGRLGASGEHSGKDPSPGQAQLGGKALDHAIPEAALEVVHYSNNSGLKTVDPKFIGKGYATRNDRRGLDASFYYVKDSPVGGDVGLTNQKGSTAYGATVSGARLYDANTDALGYWSTINRELADKMLIDHGYAGASVKTGDGREVVKLFEPLKVTKLGDGGGGTHATHESAP